MTLMILSLLFVLLMIGLLISEYKTFIESGVSKKFYFLFLSSYSFYMLSLFFSWVVSAGFLALLSLAAPVLCLKWFEGRVWQINKLSYILAGVSFVSLIVVSYDLINYYCQYPEYDYKSMSFFGFLFFFSTPAFYLVNCSWHLMDCMVETKPDNNYGCITFFPLLCALLINLSFFDPEFKDFCRNTVYEKGNILFCAEITDVSVYNVRGYKRSYLRYEITTDLISPKSQKFFVFTRDVDHGSVSKRFSYMEYPSWFEGAPFKPGKKVVIERSYFDKRVFSVRNDRPSERVINAFRRPIVEIDSAKYFLDNYADKDFLKENAEFYFRYCGINRVYKAVKLHGVKEDHLEFYVANIPYIEYIYYNPMVSGSTEIPKLDTLLFFKNLNPKISKNWVCMAPEFQTQENFSKVSEYGYYFNGRIWTKEEFESEFSELQKYF